MSTLQVTYRKSSIGYAQDQKATLAALGLKRLHQTVEHECGSSLLGMIHKVRHLVSVDGVPADSAQGLALLHQAAAGGGTKEPAS